MPNLCFSPLSPDATCFCNHYFLEVKQPLASDLRSGFLWKPGNLISRQQLGSFIPTRKNWLNFCLGASEKNQPVKAHYGTRHWPSQGSWFGLDSTAECEWIQGTMSKSKNQPATDFFLHRGQMLFFQRVFSLSLSLMCRLEAQALLLHIPHGIYGLLNYSILHHFSFLFWKVLIRVDHVLSCV